MRSYLAQLSVIHDRAVAAELCKDNTTTKVSSVLKGVTLCAGGRETLACVRTLLQGLEDLLVVVGRVQALHLHTPQSTLSLEQRPAGDEEAQSALCDSF